MRVWIGGITKKEILDMGITDIISEHDWGNWIFSIPRNEASKLRLELKE